jgi:hypothetical protein
MEAGPLKPMLPHIKDEDLRKYRRLNMWTLPFQCHVSTQDFLFRIPSITDSTPRG